MSQTKYPMPSDVRRTAIELVRGYERRVHVYNEARQQILHGSPCNFVSYLFKRRRRDGSVESEIRRQYFPHGSAISDPTVDKYIRLEALEGFIETKRMRVVEHARLNIGTDIQSIPEREKLRSAIWDSCIEGRNFIFEYRNLCVGKTNFYERRSKFLAEIAKNTDFL